MSDSDGRYSQPNSPRTVRAYCEGRAASRAGANISTNPHNALVDNECHTAWDRGHKSYSAGRTVVLKDCCAQTGLVEVPTVTVTQAPPETDPSGLTLVFTPDIAYTLTYFFGDGTTQEAEDGAVTHTYPAAATYSVQVFGPSGSQVLSVTPSGVAGFDWYVDSVTGNDAEAGNTPALAFKTLGAALAVVSNDETIGIAADSILRERADLTTLTGVKVYRYGEGENPILTDATLVTSGWTKVGNEYRRALAAEPPNVYHRGADYSTATMLVLGTYGALTAGQWAFDTDTLSIRLAGDADPAGDNIEIPSVPTEGNIGLLDFAVGAEDWEVNDLQLMFSGGDGIRSDAAGLVLNRCRMAYNSTDGFGSFLESGTILNGCISEWNGNGNRDEGAAGDGVSIHGDSTGEINGGLYRYNDKCQINNIDSASVTTRRALIISGTSTLGCWRIQGTDGGGVHRIESSILVHEGTDPLDNCIDCQTPTPVTVVDCSLLSANETANNGIRFTHATPTGAHTVRNNIVVKFAKGINYTGDVVQDVDYNCLWDNNTNYYVNGGTGLFAGAHDITADPLWTDTGGLDFTLGNGSPCVAAGGPTTALTDYAGVAFKSPPSIGALEK